MWWHVSNVRNPSEIPLRWLVHRLIKIPISGHYHLLYKLNSHFGCCSCVSFQYWFTLFLISWFLWSGPGPTHWKWKTSGHCASCLGWHRESQRFGQVREKKDTIIFDASAHHSTFLLSIVVGEVPPPHRHTPSMDLVRQRYWKDPLQPCKLIGHIDGQVPVVVSIGLAVLSLRKEMMSETVKQNICRLILLFLINQS